MSAPRSPRENHLLAVLSTSESQRLFSLLELVTLPLGAVLYESGDQLHHVHFPTDSIVPLLYVLADGASAEIAVVGNEGVIGIAWFMGGETAPHGQWCRAQAPVRLSVMPVPAPGVG